MLKPTKIQKYSAKKCCEKPHQIWIPAGEGANAPTGVHFWKNKNAIVIPYQTGSQGRSEDLDRNRLGSLRCCGYL